MPALIVSNILFYDPLKVTTPYPYPLSHPIHRSGVLTHYG